LLIGVLLSASCQCEVERFPKELSTTWQMLSLCTGNIFLTVPYEVLKQFILSVLKYNLMDKIMRIEICESYKE
jgi:hypothetical protein